MARLARLALIPLTLAAAAPAVAQADTGAGAANTAGILGSVANLKLYPLAGSHMDPLSNVVGTSIGGIPVSTQPVTDAVSDGLPVRDLPLLSGLMNAPAADAAAAAAAVAPAAPAPAAAPAAVAPAAAPAVAAPAAAAAPDQAAAVAPATN
jgi:hypothetical protein